LRLGPPFIAAAVEERHQQPMARGIAPIVFIAS